MLMALIGDFVSAENVQSWKSHLRGKGSGSGR